MFIKLYTNFDNLFNHLFIDLLIKKIFCALNPILNNISISFKLKYIKFDRITV